jgi:hypothetical protein
MILHKEILRLAKALCFAATFICSAYGRNTAPLWIDENRRNADYPSQEWFVGFSQNTLTNKSNVAESIKRLESDAQNKLSESIVVRISGVSLFVENTSERMSKGGKRTESSSDYSHNFQTSTSVELTKTQVHSYHDVKTNRIYAFAAVRKSDLADYCVAKIEFALSQAQRNIERSKRCIESDRIKEAREKLNDSKRFIDSTINNYQTLLITLDAQNAVSRLQTERINGLFKEAAAVLADIEAGRLKTAVFVVGAENMQSGVSDIIVSGLQALLLENDVAVAENDEEAGFILKTDAKVCDSRFDGNFHYANACVKVTLRNTKTGKTEVIADVDIKEGGLNPERAGEAAFKSAVSQVWAKIKDKVL